MYNYKLANFDKNNNTISMMESSEKFKKRFLELVSDFDCKKSEIPKILNIDYNIFIKIIEFGIIPQPKILIRIADYFNISIEYLLCRTDDSYIYKFDNRIAFIERYDTLIKEKGLTDYKISKKLHISTSYISNWRKKKYTPSLINLIELSEIFKVTIDFLLGRTDDRN